MFGNYQSAEVKFLPGAFSKASASYWNINLPSYMVACLLALPAPPFDWSRPLPSPAGGCGWEVGPSLPPVGVVGVGWDEETGLEAFPSLLWEGVGGGLINRGVT